MAVLHERCHFDTEFPLSRLHCVQRTGLLGHVLENFCVGLRPMRYATG